MQHLFANTLFPAPIDPVAAMVFFIVVFAAVGVVFLFIHLVMGSVIRPSVPDPEKLTIYECGEPTVGSAWVQFDLRYYVVALLFVIFDVEVAFFFPWATVFGKANQLADLSLPAIEQKAAAYKSDNKKPELTESEKSQLDRLKAQRQRISSALLPSELSVNAKRSMGLATYATETGEDGKPKVVETAVEIKPEEARTWARIAFFDIAIFFGVLMVGFAYVWRRGDIDWVRAFAVHKEPTLDPEKPLEQHH